MSFRHEDPAGRHSSALNHVRHWMGVLLVLAGHATEACRFNVRDVGFVDLEPEAYRLHVFVPPGRGLSEEKTFTREVDLALRDSSVTVEFIPAEVTESLPARSLRERAGEGAETWVLLSDAENLRSPLGLAGVDAMPGPRETMAWCLESVMSPTRREILDGVRRGFGVILLLEGSDESATQRARDVIAESIVSIRAQMPSLPKKIAEPPLVVRVRTADRTRERVLLWALRQEVAATTEPRLAIVYGRGRWIGPVMKGEEIRMRNITGIFDLIGADCECGLDLAWTQGTRLPLAWEERGKADLVRSLGFDPDNPEIRSEVSWILSRRGDSRRTGVSEPMTARKSEGAEPMASSARALDGQRDVQSRDGTIQKLAWWGGGGAGVVLAVGGWLLWKLRRA